MRDRPQSKGGAARAVALSHERKSEIGRLGSEARWGADVDPAKVGHAQLAKDLLLGPVIIPCAVLEDGTRVLSERGISRALGRTRSGSHWQKKREQGAQLPLYLTSDNLKPFISNELTKALSRTRLAALATVHGSREAAIEVWLCGQDPTRAATKTPA